MIKTKPNSEIILKALNLGLPIKFGDIEYRIIDNKLCFKTYFDHETIGGIQWNSCDDWTINWFLKVCNEKTDEEMVNIIYGLVQIEEKLEKNPEMEKWFELSN